VTWIFVARHTWCLSRAGIPLWVWTMNNRYNMMAVKAKHCRMTPLNKKTPQSEASSMNKTSNCDKSSHTENCLREACERPQPGRAAAGEAAKHTRVKNDTRRGAPRATKIQVTPKTCVRGLWAAPARVHTPRAGARRRGKQRNTRELKKRHPREVQSLSLPNRRLKTSLIPTFFHPNTYRFLQPPPSPFRRSLMMTDRRLLQNDFVETGNVLMQNKLVSCLKTWYWLLI